MKYDAKTHHRRSIRLQGYDYAQNGAYFITICVHEEKCIFGSVVNHKMVLNEFGIIAHDEWIKSSKIRAEIEIDECVIMPNHLHGIVFIQNQSSPTLTGKTTGFKNKSIGSLVAGYKSTVTKQINLIRGMPATPVWQRNYYEHIIRNEESLAKIREYVINNPQTWAEDKFYLNNNPRNP